MKQILLATLAAIALNGCNKSKPEELPALPLCQPSLVIYPTTNDTIHLTYNNDGKVETATLKETISNFYYSGNTTTITKLIDGLYTGRTIITNNTNGFAINLKTELNAPATDWINSTYEYNGDELDRITRTHSDGTPPDITVYAWINHNLVSITSGSTTTRLQYYPDKPSQEGDYLSLLNLLGGYKVYNSKNLVKSIDAMELTYVFRPDGKISSIIADGTPFIKYEYDCE